MALEIERKYVNVSNASVVAKLVPLPAVPGPVHLESNVLFDTPDGALAAAGRILRLRKQEWAANVRWWLTFKYAPDPESAEAREYKIREEDETEIGDGAALEKILADLGFFPVARYQKVRQSWVMNQCENEGIPTLRPGETIEVSVDELPFCTAVELEGPPAALTVLERMLGLDKSSISTKSYYALFQDWLAANKLPPATDFVFSPQKVARIRKELGIVG